MANPVTQDDTTLILFMLESLLNNHGHVLTDEHDAALARLEKNETRVRPLTFATVEVNALVENLKELVPDLYNQLSIAGRVALAKLELLTSYQHHPTAHRLLRPFLSAKMPSEGFQTIDLETLTAIFEAVGWKLVPNINLGQPSAQPRGFKPGFVPFPTANAPEHVVDATYSDIIPHEGLEYFWEYEIDWDKFMVRFATSELLPANDDILARHLKGEAIIRRALGIESFTLDLEPIWREMLAGFGL